MDRTMSGGNATPLARGTEASQAPSRSARRRLLLTWASVTGAFALALYLALHKYEVDIAVYLMGGAHALRSDLYSIDIPDRPFLVFTYPPFAALLFWPLARGLTLRSAQVLWALVNIGALFALLSTSIRLARPHLTRDSTWRLAGLLMLPAVALNPVFLTIGLGQINLVLCVVVLWDLCGTRRVGRITVPLGIGTGIAAAIKLTPLIFIPYLLLTGRRRGALNATATFGLCTALAVVAAPRTSWQYWTHLVFDSQRAGALFDTSDQNLRSALSRLGHAPVPASLLWPVVLVTGLFGLGVAVRAHRQSSPLLGLLVCADVALLVSPITWTHHLVWIVPMIAWLALAKDAPRYGRQFAAGLALLFWVAPIWWVPTTWLPSATPPELREHGWQLLAGNSFCFALVLFLLVTAALQWRRPPPPERGAERRGPHALQREGP